MSSVPEEVLFFGGGILLVACVLLIAHWWERRRTAALEQVSLRLGMTFLGTDPGAELQPFTQLPLFRRGNHGRVMNVARGDRIFVFGYRYLTGSGKNRTTHNQTVAAFELSRRVAAFELAPEGFFDRVASVFGGQDIDFPDDPEFSRRYRLRGEDETAVRELFHAGIRQHLMGEGGWSVEGDGDWALVFRAGKRAAPDDLVDFVEQTRRVSEVLGRA